MERKLNYKYNYNLPIFNDKESKYYYFLGAAITDGCISENKKNSKGGVSLRFNLTSKDKDWVQILHKEYGGSLKESVKYSALNIYHIDIINILMKDNCIQRKSKCVQLPNIPSEYFCHFLRGCWDGDGSISFSTSKRKRGDRIYLERTPSCYLSSASLEFLQAIKIKLNLLDINTKIVTASKAGSSHLIENNRTITCTVDNYRLICGNQQAFRLINWLGYSQNYISMPRKMSKANEIISHYTSDNFRKRRNVYNHQALITK